MFCMQVSASASFVLAPDSAEFTCADTVADFKDEVLITCMATPSHRPTQLAPHVLPLLLYSYRVVLDTNRWRKKDVGCGDLVGELWCG